MPKLRHYDHLGTARFVTFSCYRRYRYLSSPASRRAVLAGMSQLQVNHNIRILGYVLMPEHVHLVLLPPQDLELGQVIGRMKARSARQIIAAIESGSACGVRHPLTRADGSRAVWQRRCYDHNCRTVQTVREKIEYCHRNPVTRGLVSEPGAWPWSSYNWYGGQGRILLEIDAMKL